MNGTMSEKLSPTIPIKFRKKNGEWQEISLLLDTGFDGEITLDASLLGKYNLETWPDHEWLTPDKVFESDDNWKPRAPYTGKIELEGREREAGIHMVRQHPLNGMFGTQLLKLQRLTVDVVESGAVTVENMPRRSSSNIPSWLSRKTKLEEPFGCDLQDYLEWLSVYVAWTNLKVRDRRGGLNSIWVNIDTGNNQELSLPSRVVDRLELTTTGKRRVNTTDGLVERNLGEAEIIWQGRKRLVECLHIPNDKPPVIGMELLKGNRLTIDFDFPRPIAKIQRKPEQARSVRGFLDSLLNHFRP